MRARTWLRARTCTGVCAWRVCACVHDDERAVACGRASTRLNMLILWVCARTRAQFASACACTLSIPCSRAVRARSAAQPPALMLTLRARTCLNRPKIDECGEETINGRVQGAQWQASCCTCWRRRAGRWRRRSHRFKSFFFKKSKV